MTAITAGDILIYAVALFGIYTTLFFTFTVLERKEEEITKEEVNWFPKVCVIVPCYNEEDTVEKTVNSLLNLDYPEDKLEIVIVDDGSEDNTLEVAKQFEEDGVTVYHKENGGKHTALNYAWERTDAEIVGALDADSYVEPDALKKIIPYFQDEEVMSVTPALKIHPPETWLQIVQMIEYLVGIFLRKVFALLGSIHVAPGPFSMYRAEFFEEHGAWRKAYLTEDIELSLRIQDKQYHIENAPDANVYTIGPPTFKELYKQRLRWYYGFIQNVLDYKQLFSRKHGNLGVFVLPSAFISVFLVIATIFYTTWNLISTLWDKILLWNSINWDFAEMFELVLHEHQRRSHADPLGHRLQHSPVPGSQEDSR